MYVGDTPDTSDMCAFYSGRVINGEFLSFTCNPPIDGRYVKVAENGNHNFYVCEVEVYARNNQGNTLLNFFEFEKLNIINLCSTLKCFKISTLQYSIDTYANCVDLDDS